MSLRLERLLSVLRPEAQIKWSPLDNLHITTSFIGSWPEERLTELTTQLAGLVPREAFTIELKDFCWFPNPRSPQVLSIGANGDNSIQRLADQTRERLESLGLPQEKRPYAPHLTIARIKTTVPLERLRQTIEELQPIALGSFEVSHFHLYRSDPGSNASIYRKVKEFRFEAAVAAS